jgi:hypothetical protein
MWGGFSLNPRTSIRDEILKRRNDRLVTLLELRNERTTVVGPAGRAQFPIWSLLLEPDRKYVLQGHDDVAYRHRLGKFAQCGDDLERSAVDHGVGVAVRDKYERIVRQERDRVWMCTDGHDGIYVTQHAVNTDTEPAPNSPRNCAARQD